MKVENKKGLIILQPESDDFILYSVSRNTYHKMVLLGKNDSVDNYREIKKSLLEEQQENKKIEELTSRIEEQEAVIQKLSKQLSDLMDLINKK